jgi:hypothetical protein
VGIGAGLDRCGKSYLHRDSIPGRPARRQSLYRLRYPAQQTQNQISDFIIDNINLYKKVKVKHSRKRPGVAVRVPGSLGSQIP